MITIKDQKQYETLRKQAERLLQTSSIDARELPPKDAQELVHELEVHQIELELQNEELRRVQSEVESSRQKYADLYDFSPIGYVTLDTNGMIREANLTASELFDTDRQHLLNRGLSRFVAKNSHELFYAFLHSVFATDTQQSSELRLIRSQGSSFDAQMIAHARRDADGIAHFCQVALIDISERKATEALVRREQTWLRTLIETTQDALISINRQGCIVEFNQAGEKIFGYRKDEIAGQKVNVLMPEPYCSEHESYITRYEQSGEAHAIGKIRTVTAKRKNGELFPMELSVLEIPVDEEVHYAAFIRDISDRVKLQDQVVENQRLAAIGSTSAKFAHEIGNPLNGIYMTLQLLERRLKQAGLTDEKSLAVFQHVVNEIQRLNTLLSDFRSFYRDDRYNFRQVSLVELLERLLDTEVEEYTKRGIRSEIIVPSDLPLAMVDTDKLKQALLNLCKNAVEAMPQGGTLTLRAKQTAKDIVIEIADTGTGIAEGIDIWQPFKTTKSEGTGLGLVIVRQIIAAHDGTITYASEVGEGTTFYVSLPLRRDG